MTGHAIEARLYAEDATRGFQPSAGRLHRFRFPAVAGVRVDSGVEDGSEVSVHYDPMLAKVIAHAPTRHEAARALAGALGRGAALHGVTTNRDLLVRILRHPEFLAGDIDTGFLVRHDPAVLGAPAGRRRHAAAARRGRGAGRPRPSAAAHAPVLAAMPSGWRNNPSVPQTAAFTDRRRAASTSAYRFDRAGRCTLLAVDGERARRRLVASCTPDAVVLERRRGARGATRSNAPGPSPSSTAPTGASVLNEVERFPLPGASWPPARSWPRSPGRSSRWPWPPATRWPRATPWWPSRP